MAHVNEFAYLQRFLTDWPSTAWIQSLDGARVLNIGTADHDGAIDYRPLFPGRSFLNIDAQAGPGVDVQCDLTGSCIELQGERFAAVLCCSVLEHCERPWLAAANIAQKLLLPQGLLYVTVPWIWRYHSYPKDYWRMSADGIKVLFPTIRWKRVDYLTQRLNEVVPPTMASKAPWRIGKGERVYLSSQLLCMIGRSA